MKLKFAVVCVFLIILSTLCTKSASKRNPKKHSKKRSKPMIANGDFVSIKDYPFVVGLLILYEGYAKQICGGSIIAKYHVLTAAHCINEQAKVAMNLGKFVVRGGGTNIRGKLGYDHRVYGYKLHEDYNQTVFTPINDIALIQVKDPLNNMFEDSIKCAPFDYVQEGAGFVLGWGRTDLNGTNSLKLRGGPVKVLWDCSDDIWWMDPGWLCAKPTINRKGDDGGPLVQKSTLVGITLFTKSCGFDCATVFTKVGYFAEWIKTNMDTITSLDK